MTWRVGGLLQARSGRGIGSARVVGGAAAVCLLLAGCGTLEPEAPARSEVEQPDPVPPDTVPPTFVTPPPEGTLPWPHHDPDWSAAEYQTAEEELWVVNNYGLYQGGADRGGVYLHDGLDFALPNGTPIFAIEAGQVRANIGGSSYYRTLIIEDEDELGYAWGYTHVYSFRVQPGDIVHQGTRLASVNFLGLEHIHLDRLKLRPGGDWQEWTDLIHLQPDRFFAYTDTEPPVFEGPFRYVVDGTDTPWLPDPASGGMVTVKGDVDIVAGIRDPGEWARSSGPFAGPEPYGDRNTPARVELEISRAGTVVHQTVSFDFSETALPRYWGSAHASQALSFYQHYPAVQPEAPPVGNHNRKFSFFLVTHEGGIGADGELDYARRGGAWRTAETDDQGRPRFPNGVYAVRVRALDYRGNEAVRVDSVKVDN